MISKTAFFAVSPARARLALGALLLSGALLTSACDRQSDAPEQGANGTASAENEPAVQNAPPPHPTLSGKVDRSHKGEMPPADLAFTAPDGSKVSLADFRGKPLLLNLWATWCAPCRAEMPTLDALAAEQGDKLNVLVVSQDIQGREVIDPFFAKSKFKVLEPYSDTETALALGFGTGVMPTTIFFDADGREVFRVLGGYHWNSAEAKKEIQPYLSKTGL